MRTHTLVVTDEQVDVLRSLLAEVTPTTWLAHWRRPDNRELVRIAGTIHLPEPLVENRAPVFPSKPTYALCEACGGSGKV